MDAREKALRFYADPKSYAVMHSTDPDVCDSTHCGCSASPITMDEGEMAREALSEPTPGATPISPFKSQWIHCRFCGEDRYTDRHPSCFSHPDRAIRGDMGHEDVPPTLPRPESTPAPREQGSMVAGNRMERSTGDFVRACEVLLREEQERPLPNNALVSVLCDAVRLTRELARTVGAEGDSTPEPREETR